MALGCKRCARRSPRASSCGAETVTASWVSPPCIRSFFLTMVSWYLPSRSQMTSRPYSPAERGAHLFAIGALRSAEQQSPSRSAPSCPSRLCRAASCPCPPLPSSPAPCCAFRFASSGFPVSIFCWIRRIPHSDPSCQQSSPVQIFGSFMACIRAFR